MLAVLASVVFSGCRTDLEVVVRSSLMGSGSVQVVATLDDDAAKAIGPAKRALAVGDLASSGWAVRGVQPGSSGGVVIRAERAFANVAQANAVLRQLSGPTGPLPRLQLSRSRGIFSQSVSLDGTADLRSGLSAFGDAKLKELLGSSSALGLEDGEVRRQAGVPLAAAFHFRLAAALNGDPTVRWTVPFGQSVAIRAHSSEWAWATLASALAVLVGLAGLGWLLRRPGGPGVGAESAAVIQDQGLVTQDQGVVTQDHGVVTQDHGVVTQDQP